MRPVQITRPIVRNYQKGTHMNIAVASRLVGTVWAHVIEACAVTSAQEAVRRKPKTKVQKDIEELSKRPIVIRVPKTDK